MAQFLYIYIYIIRRAFQHCSGDFTRLLVQFTIKLAYSFNVLKRTLY